MVQRSKCMTHDACVYSLYKGRGEVKTGPETWHSVIFTFFCLSTDHKPILDISYTHLCGQEKLAYPYITILETFKELYHSQ